MSVSQLQDGLENRGHTIGRLDPETATLSMAVREKESIDEVQLEDSGLSQPTHRIRVLQERKGRDKIDMIRGLMFIDWFQN